MFSVKTTIFAPSNLVLTLNPITMDQLDNIQNCIFEFRGQRVMLDRDLAAMYGVETKAPICLSWHDGWFHNQRIICFLFVLREGTLSCTFQAVVSVCSWATHRVSFLSSHRYSIALHLKDMVSNCNVSLHIAVNRHDPYMQILHKCLLLSILPPNANFRAKVFSVHLYRCEKLIYNKARQVVVKFP